jgi:hypothetical protein
MMGQERRDRLRAVTIACAMLSAAIIAALVIATQREPPHVASSDPAVAGTSGLARPHPPLDRAPGEPLGATAVR